ncbi:lactonase family protein [Paralcaligenes ginsengisoli]
MRNVYIYVGSRTTRERNARGKGISVFHFDRDSARLALVQEQGGLVNPSFLAIDRAGRHLYTVHGDRDQVSSFSIDAQSGMIEYLGSQTTQGKNPVHLALSASERFLLVSNHLSSSLAVLPVTPDGLIEPPVQRLVLHGPVGPHRSEQPHSKPHFNLFDPSGRFVMVPDKGLDRIFSFEFIDGRLRESNPPFVECREHAGPRNLVFHPKLSRAYVVNELDSSVATYRFDPDKGGLEPMQIIPTLPQDFTGNSRASSIEIDPSGKFLYASNRGLDCLAVFSIDQASGWLTFLGVQETLGRTPRFFTVEPSGRFLFVANEDSDSIVTFLRDPISGGLTQVGDVTPVTSPVSIVFRTI